MRQTALTGLQRIKAMYSDPAAFLQHDWAQTKTGRSCEPQSPSATCWCLDGAIDKVFGYKDTPTKATAKKLLMNAAQMLGFPHYIKLNDSGGFSKVHECLDLAIATAEKEEGK